MHRLGHSVSIDELRFPLALSILAALNDNPFVEFVDAQVIDEDEVIVANFSVERPQFPKIDIQAIEPIAIRISKNSLVPPVVASLRLDFPTTPHQNLTKFGSPKELCIFEQPFREVRSSLNGHTLIRLISQWLARASVDELHLADQLIEPFLVASDRIILPKECFDNINALKEAPYCVEVVGNPEPEAYTGPLLLRAITESERTRRRNKSAYEYLVVPIQAKPWSSQVIQYHPDNLEQLHHLLAIVDVNVVEEIRQYIRNLSKLRGLNEYEHCRVIVLLHLPKNRKSGDTHELVEYWTFIVDRPIKALAENLGLGGTTVGSFGHLLVPDSPHGLTEIHVFALRPTRALSKTLAQVFCGIPKKLGLVRCIAIGVGSLGSHIVSNLARQGFGTWTIVDDDRLLPHNFVRQSYARWELEGISKTLVLQTELNGLLDDPDVVHSFTRDILNIDLMDDTDQLVKTLRDSDLIIDCAASANVTNTLSRFSVNAPRLTAYMNSTGLYSVLLFEGANRSVRLDDLEIQLAASLCENDKLMGFYEAISTVNYAYSCRDMSTIMPYELISLHAAAISRFIRMGFDIPDAHMKVWEWSNDNTSLICHDINVCQTVVMHSVAWTVRVSQCVVDFINEMRERKLPNETGGVLLGRLNYDIKTIYVGLAVPSPSDSIEHPTGYIRGTNNLLSKIQELTRMSGGILNYVGEWHTHPSGNQPSNLDHEAMKLLGNRIAEEGTPILLMIQGTEDVPRILVHEQHAH